MVAIIALVVAVLAVGVALFFGLWSMSAHALNRDVWRAHLIEPHGFDPEKHCD